ncbi:MAG: lactate utilization protein C [Candidatus Bathyarchaeia archaeon]
MQTRTPRTRLAETFLRELTATGGVGVELDEEERIVDYVVQRCLEHKASSAVRANRQLLADLEIDAALRAAGISIHVDSEGKMTKEALSKADVGIVEADVAVAESGTVAFVTTHEADRLLSCLPSILISLVRRSNLVRSLEEAFAFIQRATAGQQQHVISLVTGPSQTGDIGLTLVKGAHGPRIVCCIIHGGK